MRAKEQDIQNMAFKTCYGHYKFLVMSFGLTDTPIMFIDIMNKVFQPYLDKFVVVFINEILVYSHFREEHEQHLRIMLETLRTNKLYVNLSKCEFLLSKVVFLGHVISNKGIYVDPKKVEVVLKWEHPTNMIEIQSFLGLVGYYQRDFQRLLPQWPKWSVRESSSIGQRSARGVFKKLRKDWYWPSVGPPRGIIKVCSI